MEPGTRKYNRVVCGALAAATVLCLSCSLMPFFPPTGKPLSETAKLATPQSTISQLLNSYETRRIDLFQEVLDPDSFRFYPTPTFLTEYQSNLGGILQKDSIGSQFTNVPANNYLFWTVETELHFHQILFGDERVISISFNGSSGDALPQVNPDDFVYHVNAPGDTVGVEVLMLEGQFTVDYKLDPNDYYIIEQPVAIEKQVFYLVKNGAGTWLIRKWFDMGSATGL
jgi:hypothetical protein